MAAELEQDELLFDEEETMASDEEAGIAAEATVVGACSDCGAKIYSNMSKVGGNPKCSHRNVKWGVPATAAAEVEAELILPTDAERNWLRTINNNEKEAAKHISKFNADLCTLGELKNGCHESITNTIARVQEKLREREELLLAQLETAYDLRASLITENTRTLEAHQTANKNCNRNVQKVIKVDDETQEREKKVVKECSAIVSSTPKLKYIPTKLKIDFTGASSAAFASMKLLEKSIDTFGALLTLHETSGVHCQFPSQRNKNALSSPVEVDLPRLNPKSCYFNKQGALIEYVFAAVAGDGSGDGDEDELKGGEGPGGPESKEEEKMDSVVLVNTVIEAECISKGHVPTLQDWSKASEKIHHNLASLNIKSGNYSLKIGVKGRFDPGWNVYIRTRLVFKSPNKKRFLGAEGLWSPKVLNVSIPVEKNVVGYAWEFEGKKANKEYSMGGQVSLADFQKDFLHSFKVHVDPAKNEELVLFAKLANGLKQESIVLTGESDLGCFTCEKGYCIAGFVKQKQMQQKPIPSIGAFLCTYGSKQKKIMLRKKNDEYTVEAMKRVVKKKLNIAAEMFDIRLGNKELVTEDSQVYQHLLAQAAADLVKCEVVIR